METLLKFKSINCKVRKDFFKGHKEVPRFQSTILTFIH
jgi:hypothetical protein